MLKDGCDVWERLNSEHTVVFGVEKRGVHKELCCSCTEGYEGLNENVGSEGGGKQKPAVP